LRWQPPPKCFQTGVSRSCPHMTFWIGRATVFDEQEMPSGPKPPGACREAPAGHGERCTRSSLRYRRSRQRAELPSAEPSMNSTDPQPVFSTRRAMARSLGDGSRPTTCATLRELNGRFNVIQFKEVKTTVQGY
jgi:hypothetical protein